MKYIVGVLLAFISTSAFGVECSNHRSDGAHWQWREVSGRKCWYQSARRVSKGDLTWRVKSADEPPVKVQPPSPPQQPWPESDPTLPQFPEPQRTVEPLPQGHSDNVLPAVINEFDKSGIWTPPTRLQQVGLKGDRETIRRQPELLKPIKAEVSPGPTIDSIFAVIVILSAGLILAITRILMASGKPLLDRHHLLFRGERWSSYVARAREAKIAVTRFVGNYRPVKFARIAGYQHRTRARIKQPYLVSSQVRQDRRPDRGGHGPHLQAVDSGTTDDWRVGDDSPIAVWSRRLREEERRGD